jgi:hypothetical protein
MAMQLTAPTGRTRTTPADRTEAPHTDVDRTEAPRPGADRTDADRARRVGLHDADGMAVASFLLGLVGLLTMNIVLGPAALVLSTLALRRGTTRRFRARLGFGLGVADLVVLVAVVDLNNAISWSFGG